MRTTFGRGSRLGLPAASPDGKIALVTFEPRPNEGPPRLGVLGINGDLGNAWLCRLGTSPSDSEDVTVQPYRELHLHSCWFLAASPMNYCTHALAFGKLLFPWPTREPSNVAVNSQFARLPYKPIGESDHRPNYCGQHPQLKIVQIEPVNVHFHFLTVKGFQRCSAAAEQRSPSTVCLLQPFVSCRLCQS